MLQALDNIKLYFDFSGYMLKKLTKKFEQFSFCENMCYSSTVSVS